jgi:hypothetical protein
MADQVPETLLYQGEKWPRSPLQPFRLGPFPFAVPFPSHLCPLAAPLALAPRTGSWKTDHHRLPVSHKSYVAVASSWHDSFLLGRSVTNCQLLVNWQSIGFSAGEGNASLRG